MYYLKTFVESVRIPPSLFGLKLDKAALQILREKYERTVAKEQGIIVSLHEARVKSKGRIIQGDGAAYFDVEYDALVFTPQINEVIVGEVTELLEFGAFVRMGPIDGLVHVSQVADDFFSYDKKKEALVGKQSKQTIKKGDLVKAKIATVSLKDSVANSKIALTMRPDGFGKIK